MAFNPEEFKARRAAREQQRREKEKKQRILRIRLIVAAGALLTCAILVLLLTRPWSKAPAATEPANQTESTVPPAQQTVIHLAAAGDLNITENVVAAGGYSYDYTQAFLDVAHLLADADVSVVNLEGTLTGEPYGTDRSAPQNMMDSLAAAGVDYIQMANSYSIYKGMEGLKSTLSGIQLAGMEPLGAYASADDAAAAKGYSIRTVKGVKIAFVSFTKGMDGMALPPGNEGCVNVLYKDYASDYQEVDTEGITAILSAVAKEKPDVTVAFLHWGSEFNNNVSHSQTEICELLQKNGVDAIIGTHSHYVQKMEYDPESGSFIAYSLGDFFGDADRAGSEYSVVLDLEITKNTETGETKITNYSYTPIFTMVETDLPLRILRIREALTAFEDGYLDKVSQESYDKMAYALERIEARVKGE